VRDSRGLLILLVVVVVIAAGVWLWTRPQPDRGLGEPTDREPIRFHYSEVAVRSPDLEVGPADVKGAIHPDYTSWRVTLTCGEIEGCAGEFAVELRYTTGSDDERLVLVSRCDVPSGGEMLFGGLQDPPTPVGRIERLSLEMRERATPGQEHKIPL